MSFLQCALNGAHPLWDAYIIRFPMVRKYLPQITVHNCNITHSESTPRYCDIC